MKISEQELFDYIECPALYDMKYKKRIPYSETKTMQSLLNVIVNYFYSNLLNKKVCTMDELKRKWDSVCITHKDFMNSKRNLEGINYIVNFARWTADNKIILLDFNSIYKVIVDDVEVNGSIGAISVLPDRKCELVINRFSNRELNQSDIDKKLKYTLDCYAFKMAYDYDITAIKVINHKNNSVLITQRTITDYDRLESTIRGVANGISSDSFYPRETVFCSQCCVKHICKYWN